MNFLKRLWIAMNDDMTGKETTRRSTHPFFGRIIHFGARGKQGYWEAEMSDSRQPQRYSIEIPARDTDSLDRFSEFFQAHVRNADALFDLCKDALQAACAEDLKRLKANDWRTSLILDSVTLPPNADPSNEWNACWQLSKTGRYFTVNFAKNKILNVDIEG